MLFWSDCLTTSSWQGAGQLHWVHSACFREWFGLCGYCGENGDGQISGKISYPRNFFLLFQVRFLNSSNVLANITEHTRTLRLYPRPVVAFQHNSFLRSRPRHSAFTNKLCQTQAVEFLGEWLLVPPNLAYQRIHTGLMDPTVIGDKFKWFAHNLDPVSFIVWDNLSSLNTALKCLADNETVATDESGSDSDGGSSSSSFSSLSELGLSKEREAEAEGKLGGDLHSQPYPLESSKPPASLMNSGLDPDTVYDPPKSLQVRNEEKSYSKMWHLWPICFSLIYMDDGWYVNVNQMLVWPLTAR